MKIWGQFSLDPSHIPLLSVSFYIYFVFLLWTLFRSSANISEFPYEQTCSPVLYKEVKTCL